MSSPKGQPAFVLHSYDWSESSSIVELFTAESGRVAVVAKGAKKPSSNFRPVLLPLQAIAVRYKHFSSDLGVLQSARWRGGRVMPADGERLMAGCFVNELMVRLLPRDDPYPALFMAYAQFVELLHSQWESGVLIRAFELLALQQLGHLPSLQVQYNGQALDAQAAYALQPDWGLCAPDALPTSASRTEAVVAPSNAPTLSGRHWLELAQVLSVPLHAPQEADGVEDTVYFALLRVLERWSTGEHNALRRCLQASVQQHTGRAQLRTRQVLMDMVDLG